MARPLKTKDKHVHQYKEAVKKVLLTSGRKQGYDILKMRVCVAKVGDKVCGHREAYEIKERVVL
jgi:hypothetical protein